MPKIDPLSRNKFEKFLRYIGCEKIRTKGDHIIYRRAGLKRPVVIVVDKEISPFIIRSNLRTLGISVEQFKEILSRL